MLTRFPHPGSWLRPLHTVAAVLMFVLLSWGLLSVNPLAAVNGTSFRYIRHLDDFLLHLCAYSITTATLMSLVIERRPGRHRLLIRLIVTHAVATELLQVVIPRRTCDPIDLTANLLGIALGVRLVSLWPQISSLVLQLKTGQSSNVRRPTGRV